MARGYYEKEQERLLRLLSEVETDEEIEIDDDNESLVDDHVETINEDTDSEQNFSEDETQTVMSEGLGHRIPCFIGKDGVTRWRKHSTARKAVRTRAENLVTNIPGVRGIAQEKKEPLDIWSLFFTDDMLEMIMHYTNKYIQLKNYNPSYRTSRQTDVIEIKALIGLLYISGATKSNHQSASDLFRTNGLSMEIYRLTMSLERFRFLLRNLRFDDKTTREDRLKFDKMAAIREFFDSFTANLPKYYCMSHYTTIDEMLQGFRGRCGFRVYMPNKPRKYGIKIYALVDAKMFYTSSMEVYVGKQPDGPYSLDTSNIALVPRLCRPIWGTRRNVTMDNFFTSMELTSKLLQDHQLTTIGTLRKNKRQIPPVFVNVKRPEYSSMFAFKEQVTLVSYIPRKNKNVLLLSSMHFSDEIDILTGKPEIIIDYNTTKGGVDVVDKLCETYNCARATCRWPMVLFYSTMNVAGINSYIIYKSNTENYSAPRQKFLEQLGFDLVNQHIKRRSTQENIPRTIRLRLSEVTGIQNENEPPRGNIYGRCNYCSSKKNRKTKYCCHRCHKYMCLEHLTPVCRECSQMNDG